MCNAGAQSSSTNYINSPPTSKPGMTSKPNGISNESGSENSSLTAVNEGGQIQSYSTTAADPDGQKAQTKYEQWYPGDASNNGRPSWWNKWFCCGYGLGCLLCPCSSWNCKHERS